MRAEWSDAALVLAVGRFRETDMWVRLLTRRHGVVQAFAFGGSRSRRRFSGCLDVLNFLRVRAVTSGNGRFLNLEEGVLVEGPQRLRSDLTRLGMAMNCVRFLEAMDPPQGDTYRQVPPQGDTYRGGAFAQVPPQGDTYRGGAFAQVPPQGDTHSGGGGDQPSQPHPRETVPTTCGVSNFVLNGKLETRKKPDAAPREEATVDPFALMHSLFTRLEAATPVSDALPVLFRLRLASDQGYAPPFAVCAACDKPLLGQGGFFSIAEGVLLCPECGGRSRQNLWVSAPALDVLAEVQATLPETWQPETLQPAQRRECLRLVDAFVQYHLGLTWERGRFRRS